MIKCAAGSPLNGHWRIVSTSFPFGSKLTRSLDTISNVSFGIIATEAATGEAGEVTSTYSHGWSKTYKN